MADIFLQLNVLKAKVIKITPADLSTSSINDLSSSLGALSKKFCKEAQNRGVIFDSNLSFDIQVLLRPTQTIDQNWLFLSPSVLVKVVHAFISSRPDYCNALYSSINNRNIHRHQLIQNAAARLLTHSKRSDHQSLQPFTGFLQVLELILGFYSIELGTPCGPDHFLRSSRVALLVTRKSRLATKGDRVFSVAPQLWNSLPGNLRRANSMTSFKSPLLTYFYRLAFSLQLSMFGILFICFKAYFCCFNRKTLCNFAFKRCYIKNLRSMGVLWRWVSECVWEADYSSREQPPHPYLWIRVRQASADTDGCMCLGVCVCECYLFLCVGESGE